MGKNPPTMWETRVQSLDQDNPLEKRMATHSTFLAWRIPWTEEPCGLQSTRSQRVGHDWETFTFSVLLAGRPHNKTFLKNQCHNIDFCAYRTVRPCSVTYLQSFHSLHWIQIYTQDFCDLRVLPGFPWWLRWESICLQCWRPGFDPWVGKILWRRKWQPTPVLLPGKSHGRSLVGYSPWGRKESDTTERLYFTSGFYQWEFYQSTSYKILGRGDNWGGEL